MNFPGVGTLRLIGAEDLVIHKCVAGRPRDLEDVEAILIRQRLNLHLDTVRKWLEAFREVVDSHDPLELFEQILSKAQQDLKKER